MSQFFYGLLFVSYVFGNPHVFKALFKEEMHNLTAPVAGHENKQHCSLLDSRRHEHEQADLPHPTTLISVKTITPLRLGEVKLNPMT